MTGTYKFPYQGAIDAECTYANTAPFGSMDAKERIALITEEGLERVILYPTIELLL